MEIDERIKEIKQSFRQMMDGAVAQSMREKGVDYKLNWGATLPRLKEMAEEIKGEPNMSTDDCYHLAIALWKENVRECKILATMRFLRLLTSGWRKSPRRRLPNNWRSTCGSTCRTLRRKPTSGWPVSRSTISFADSMC